MTEKDRRAIHSLLVRYLPIFEDASKTQCSWEEPVLKEGNPRTLVVHKPEYSDTLIAFFEEVSQTLQDRQYLESPVANWLEDPDFLQSATLKQMRSVFTWICRGERFCDGHWDEQLRNRNILRSLIRLRALATEQC